MRPVDTYSIGVDLGGTNLRAAAFDELGHLLAKVSGSTPIETGPDAVVADIARAVDHLREQFGRDKLAGIGAGVPGNILMDQGIIAGWGNMPSFNGYPMRAELEKRVGARVFLENDANAAALGEKWMGAGRSVDDLVMLTLGTGVGGGIIAGGRPLHGYLGMAGELGHITVVPNGNPCGCGNQGCLEKHASASAVTAMAKLMRLGDALSSKDVFDLAKTTGEAGDKARHIWKVVGEALGLMMAMLINTFNFPLYLLSGGMLPAWELFEPHMTRVAKERSFTFRATLTETRIAQATLGNEAGLYGAAYLPWIEQ